MAFLHKDNEHTFIIAVKIKIYFCGDFGCKKSVTGSFVDVLPDFFDLMMKHPYLLGQIFVFIGQLGDDHREFDHNQKSGHHQDQEQGCGRLGNSQKS